ncbi:hypothetical protein K7X08_030603 [Anisodus acutangulus]|uniref:Uncharacterized protein n=1 Tax=Anisodus acutangulus TaxID=402998 RepID=A0A9Q1MRR4_9SOLA|nr:hypothetical protein K7X08_030603 [Anisodus acutangulus]
MGPTLSSASPSAILNPSNPHLLSSFSNPAAARIPPASERWKVKNNLITKQIKKNDRSGGTPFLIIRVKLLKLIINGISDSALPKLLNVDSKALNPNGITITFTCLKFLITIGPFYYHLFTLHQKSFYLHPLKSWRKPISSHHQSLIRAFFKNGK